MICTFKKRNFSKWAKEKEWDGPYSTPTKDESYMQILEKINELEVVCCIVILQRTCKEYNMMLYVVFGWLRINLAEYELTKAQQPTIMDLIY